MTRPIISNRKSIQHLLFFVMMLGLSACGNTESTQNELEIDPVKVSPEFFEILFENEYTRVIRYTLEPGQKDNWHTHPAKTSYVLSGGNLKITLDNGEELIVEEKEGMASWMNSVGRHNAENIGETTVSILLTEFNAKE